MGAMQRNEQRTMATSDIPARSRPARPARPPRAAGSASGAPAFALTWRDARRGVGVLLAAALLLLAADMLSLRAHPGVYTIDVGTYRDSFFIGGANEREATADGNTYRWSDDGSTIWLNQVGVAPHALLTLQLGGRPEPGELRLTLNDQPWADLVAQTQPRDYTLLLPPDAPDQLTIGMHGATFAVPGDTRRLGVKLENVLLTIPRGGAPLPIPAQYLAQLALLVAAQLAAIRLGWGRSAQAALLGILALALAVLLSAALPLAYAYLPRLAVAAAVLAALTWALLPLAERRLAWAGDAHEIRLLWALALAACAIRLVGMLFPTFGGQDLNLNMGRLIKVITGQMVIIAGSSEFANGQTIYPPGPYLSLLPGAPLIGDLQSLLQGGLALLDGVTAFFVALLARRLGGGRDAARMALILYAGSIPAFTAMSFGFSAQIFGQWFTTPIALVLLAPETPRRARTWALAVTLLLFSIFSHIGVAILGVSWFAIMLGLLLLRPHRGLWLPILTLGAGGLLALGLLYIDVVPLTLSHVAGTVSQRHVGYILRGATPLLLKGARLAYSDAGLVLFPLGLLLIDRARMGAERLATPLAWLLTLLLFLAIDLLLAVQVRYFYFALPLALASIALWLGRLAARGRSARLVAWAFTLLIALQGIIMWYSTAMGSGRLSMTPLTH